MFVVLPTLAGLIQCVSSGSQQGQQRKMTQTCDDSLGCAVVSRGLSFWDVSGSFQNCSVFDSQSECNAACSKLCQTQSVQLGQAFFGQSGSFQNSFMQRTGFVCPRASIRQPGQVTQLSQTTVTKTTNGVSVECPSNVQFASMNVSAFTTQIQNQLVQACASAQTADACRALCPSACTENWAAGTITLSYVGQTVTFALPPFQCPVAAAAPVAEKSKLMPWLPIVVVVAVVVPVAIVIAVVLKKKRCPTVSRESRVTSVVAESPLMLRPTEAPLFPATESMKLAPGATLLAAPMFPNTPVV